MMAKRMHSTIIRPPSGSCYFAYVQDASGFKRRDPIQLICGESEQFQWAQLNRLIDVDHLTQMLIFALPMPEVPRPGNRISLALPMPERSLDASSTDAYHYSGPKAPPDAMQSAAAYSRWLFSLRTGTPFQSSERTQE